MGNSKPWTLRARAEQVERNIKRWEEETGGDDRMVFFIVRMVALVEKSPGRRAAYIKWLEEHRI